MTVYSPIQIVQINSFGITGGAGTFSMPGVKTGDVVIGVNHITTGKSQPVGYNAIGQFMSIVSEDDVMEQTSGDAFADNEFVFTLLRLNQEG